MNLLIQNIIGQLKEVQTGKIWIGGSFESKLDQLNETQVFKRPYENVHSVAEILSHLTLWRMETILKIKTGKGSRTDDCEENWLTNDQLETMGWDKLKSDYDNSLTVLIDLIKDKNDDFLNQEYYDTDFKGDYPYSFVLNGMLHHDIYHLGQLGLIIKLLKEKK